MPMLVVAVTLACWTYCRPLSAQAPALGYAFPPAVQIGETAVVQLGGYDFTSDMQFFSHHPGVKLETEGRPGEFFVPPPPYWFGEKSRDAAFPIPREVEAQVTLATDVTPGLARWQVANANGVSAAAVLLATAEPVFVERRWRDDPQTLPTLSVKKSFGVSGRIGKIAEVDRYRCTVEQDGPVTAELFARRLGAEFNGLLEVHELASDGSTLVMDRADTLGSDLQLTWTARGGRAYEVRLHDIDYRGNRAYVYHLKLSAGPRVVATLPATLSPGETREVQLIGYGLSAAAKSGKERETEVAAPAPLQQVQRRVEAPANAQDTWIYRLATPHGDTDVSFPIVAVAEQTVTSSQAGAGSDAVH
ncbi:MAG: hypothetical protein KDB14_16800, partial [Planctomycetales bacterium]|nr:hypothetical protein [Planctomycetales bacterium]